MRTLPLWLLLTSLPGPAWAVDAFPGLTPLAQSELAIQHGGFMLPGGAQISLGIESVVLINGEPVAHAQWLDGQVLRSRAGLDSDGLLVRPLDSLAVSGQHGLQGLGWLVQNQLDGQVIQQLNTLNLRFEGVRGLTDPALGRMLEAQSAFQVLR